MGLPVLNIIDLVRQAIVISAKAISTKTARIISRGVICGVVVFAIYYWFVGFNIPLISLNFISDLDFLITSDQTSFFQVVGYCLNIDLLISIINFVIRFLEGTIVLISTLTVSLMLSFWVDNLKNAAAEDVMDAAK